MEIKNQTIAVIVDFDNFNNDEYLQILFEELDQIGNVVYKGAFYANTEDNNISKKALKYGFNDFIVEPSYSKGKNAVDIRIALDIMELLEKEYIDSFCLATNDLDFAPIAKKIKQRNKIFIGAGLQNAKEEYKKLCHKFISVDTILKAKNEKIKLMKDSNEVKAVDTKIKKLISVVDEIIKNNEKDIEGYMLFSVLVENLQRKIPDFNPKNYGATNNKSSLFFSSKIFKNKYSVKLSEKDKTTFYIKKI